MFHARALAPYLKKISTLDHEARPLVDVHVHVVCLVGSINVYSFIIYLMLTNNIVF